MEKEAETFLKNIDVSNDLYFRVAEWLKKKQQSVYKLLNHQSVLTFDHEAFKEKEKEKKEREKEMKDKGNTDTQALLAQLEASLQVNTLSNMDFKSNYSDFKSGMKYEL